MKKIPLLIGSFVSLVSIQADALTESQLAEFSTVEQQQLALLEQTAQKATGDTQGSAVATIGFDNNCTYDASVLTTPIRDAVDSVLEYNEIRIVEGLYDEENIRLENRSIVIKGGFANCQDADNNITTAADSIETTINASTNAYPVFMISGNNGSHHLSFHNLTVQGSGSTAWYGGAFRIMDANASITLNHVAMKNNNALDGGAIGVAGTTGDTSLLLMNTEISNNTASSGGGIYCENPTAEIIINSSNNHNHGIFRNKATNGDGGGALITGGCQFTTYQGTSELDLFGDDFRGFSSNSASGNGGGLAVTAGAKANLIGRNVCTPFQQQWLCLFGNNNHPVNFNFNVADDDDDGEGNGGAVYVSGIGSTLNADNSRMTINFANNGGAVSVESLAEANIQTAHANEAGSISCWSPGSCTEIYSNFAVTSGGGFFTRNAAELNITNAMIHANRAMAGTAAYVRDSSSKLNINGSVIHSNGDNGSGDYNDTYVLRAFQGAQLFVDLSTVADNFSTNALIGNNDAYVHMGSSIYHELSGTPVYHETGNNGPSRLVDCLITHEQASIPVVGRSIVADPEFVDRANNNYRLSEGSIAIDYCDDQWTPADNLDMDGNPRNYDAPGIMNNWDAIDIGAYEKQSSDVIFKNGFE